MKNSIKFGYLAIVLATTVNTSVANELMIFPAKGQSNETMEQDKFTCYGWAKGQTGFDPMKAPTTSTPPPSQAKKGSTAGSAGRGALGGAALGAILGDSSKSAKRGAAAGGLVGGIRQSSKNSSVDQKTKEWEQKEMNNYANNRSQYNRAYSACLEGKGYTVK